MPNKRIRGGYFLKERSVGRLRRSKAVGGPTKTSWLCTGCHRAGSSLTHTLLSLPACCCQPVFAGLPAAVLEPVLGALLAAAAGHVDPAVRKTCLQARAALLPLVLFYFWLNQAVGPPATGELRRQKKLSVLLTLTGLELLPIYQLLPLLLPLPLSPSWCLITAPPFLSPPPIAAAPADSS